MRTQFHFYLNDNKVQDVELMQQLKQEVNISSLVKKLLTEHYKNLNQLRNNYKNIKEVV